MQISELNNNLLKMLTGQAGQKTEDEETPRFADLLQLSEVSESEGFAPQIVKADEKAVSYGKEMPKVSVEVQDKNSMRATAPKAEKKVKAGEKSNSIQPQKQNSDIKAEQAASRPTSETTDNSNEVSQSTGAVVSEKAVETETGTVVSENIVVAAPVVLPVPDELLAVNTGELISDVMPEDAEILPQPELNILPQTNDKPVQSDVVYDGNVNQQISEPEVETAVNPVLVEKTTGDNIVKQPEFLQEQSAEVAEVMPEKESIVRAQEEKIAELLPDDVKADIKVTVVEDKVDVTPNRLNIAPESLVVEEGVETVEDLEGNIKSDAQISENVEIQQPVAAVVEDNIKESDVFTAVKTVSSERAVSAVQAQVASAVTGEVIPSSIKTETAEIKTFEPKNLTREVAEQIKVNITQSAIKGVDKIEIQLKPADLGKVEIKLQIGRDGQLHAHIVASNAETLEILQKDIENLKQAFSSAGYQTEDGSFSFSHSQEQDNEREKMREFIGEVITHDVEEELAANDYISADGVNIRV